MFTESLHMLHKQDPDIPSLIGHTRSAFFFLSQSWHQRHPWDHGGHRGWGMPVGGWPLGDARSEDIGPVSRLCGTRSLERVTRALHVVRDHQKLTVTCLRSQHCRVFQIHEDAFIGEFTVSVHYCVMFKTALIDAHVDWNPHTLSLVGLDQK